MTADFAHPAGSSIPFPPGWVLADRYRIPGQIGHGGMADVYRAHDDVLKRPVAVKAFRRDAGVEEDAAGQVAEVRILARAQSSWRRHGL